VNIGVGRFINQKVIDNKAGGVLYNEALIENKALATLTNRSGAIITTQGGAQFINNGEILNFGVINGSGTITGNAVIGM
jgi:TPP-dependent trihydroxycyclohexane-1,2-dione (THcHDO) dehydratase